MLEDTVKTIVLLVYYCLDDKLCIKQPRKKVEKVSRTELTENPRFY